MKLYMDQWTQYHNKRLIFQRKMIKKEVLHTLPQKITTLLIQNALETQSV